MIKFHKSVPTALKYPSVWAGISGAIASVASSLTGHMQTIFLTLSGFCSVVAIVLKSPNTIEQALDKDKPDDQ